ncbi:MAG: oxidoreductase [Bacteroidetes bacterium]|nr:MAG: oxidoreductase [Bacteroidota bacterium]REK00594.1 MAG: oxidoreductase [Bacteroidota bacterium]REK35284.1 MAG: oxidoreductase [Bacteroidota bacterium]REK48360.1 MAG: oxidoreductase [Bacteroidota bacterium]
MHLLSPDGFDDYELIDCGNFLKLERFGKYVTIRPEPQAVWDPVLSEKEWNKTAHVRFVPRSSSSGDWKKLREMPDRWNVRYSLKNKNKTKAADISFRLALTSFKHVGIFPEQACNWDFIHESIGKMKTKQARVLNLFAYTGGASLAARSAGADVVHLDSIKQVVSWAKDNMELSGLSDIRWIVEDALTFVKREVKRGKKYHGIVLDPPAYGHGTGGQKWKLEDMINEMIALVKQLLEPEEHFLLLNTYSLGFSSLIVENLLKGPAALQCGELFLNSSQDTKLPLGVFGRYLQT